MIMRRRGFHPLFFFLFFLWRSFSSPRPFATTYVLSNLSVILNKNGRVSRSALSNTDLDSVYTRYPSNTRYTRYGATTYLSI
ncbi:hypothetical protein GGR50DRAFT_635227 [Xylaria sp. CBS 124048]|nr:hypothetical protein GGR50DRAFT_635227 [Xylaria sp. CBS 124048]